jgi:hypothetical protein
MRLFIPSFGVIPLHVDHPFRRDWDFLPSLGGVELDDLRIVCIVHRIWRLLDCSRFPFSSTLFLSTACEVIIDLISWQAVTAAGYRTRSSLTAVPGTALTGSCGGLFRGKRGII